MSRRTSESALDLAAAAAMAAEVTAQGRRRGLALTVAVADAQGSLITLVRMDGAAGLSVVTAQQKIATVLRTGRSTRDVTEELVAESAAEPALLLGMVVHGGITPIPGGVPVRCDGVLVGAVAVSGGSSDEDHELALLAVAARR
jgi:glc operon protein GlcG